MKMEAHYDRKNLSRKMVKLVEEYHSEPLNEKIRAILQSEVFINEHNRIIWEEMLPKYLGTCALTLISLIALSQEPIHPAILSKAIPMVIQATGGLKSIATVSKLATPELVEFLLALQDPNEKSDDDVFSWTFGE